MQPSQHKTDRSAAGGQAVALSSPYQTTMRFTLLLGVCLMAALAYGQLIIDEDDPAGKKLIDMMMKAINEHEKSTYHYKQVVYSIPIGDQHKISVLMKVTNAAGAIYSCTVELLGHDKEHFVTGAVKCNP